MPQQSPLSKKDVTDGKQAIYDLREADKIYEGVEQCGIDCRERRETCQVTIEALSKLISQFDPKQYRQES